MKVLLGYLNQSEWMYLLNIGNIMQITPLTIHDLHSTSSIEIELARDSIIEKVSHQIQNAFIYQLFFTTYRLAIWLSHTSVYLQNYDS